ncbi:MAG TPA: RES family NAD+ phosphorylase, partial [Xanthobacteraceae bacterium]|nr:RES family NAD+ phosphorylase [Xanthobacteraceae bacterium]
PWPSNAADYTAFAAAYGTRRALDLTVAPFTAARAAWTHPTDYAACQDLADTARSAEIAVIRYESARDPEKGANLALLTPAVFASPTPIDRQTWRIRLGPSGVQALCDFPAMRLGYDRTAFAADPRVAKLVWER